MFRLSKKALISAAAAVAIVPLALSGCTGTGQNTTPDSTAGASSDRTYAVITHAVPGDAFWDVLKSGAESAGKLYGVTVTYQGDPDAQKQSQLIESAIASKVDGIVVSMANPDGLRGAIGDAVKAGIPVISVNSGAEESASVGAITHVGQSELLAGEGAGTRLKDTGLKNVICVIHEAGNSGLEDRCKGASNTFGGKVTNIQVDVGNLADAQNTVKSALLADPSIDGVLSLNPSVGIAAAQAVDEAGSSAKVATFDVSADVIKQVEDGKILFAIDQQPYLQGYLPVVFFELYHTNGNTVGGGQPVYSGPGFITKENAAQVAKFAANGTR